MLITHKLESLRYVDYVYIFKAGKIVAEGDFQTVKQSAYYKEIEEKANKEVEEKEEIELNENKENNLVKKRNNTTNRNPKEKNEIQAVEESNETADNLTLDEDKQIDSFSLSLWKDFFSSFGSKKYFTVMIFGKIYIIKKNI